jgi:hypothetical protein
MACSSYPYPQPPDSNKKRVRYSFPIRIAFP